MTLQERLAELFPAPQARGLQAAIMRLCGVSRPTVSAWFNNAEKVSTLSRTHAEIICAQYAPTVSPAWLAEGKGPKHQAAAHPGAVLVEGAAEMHVIEALKRVDSTFSHLSPVLVQPARDAVAKWARGEATDVETAATLEAFFKASAALPKAPAAVAETPVKAKIK